MHILDKAHEHSISAHSFFTRSIYKIILLIEYFINTDDGSQFNMKYK